MFKKDFQMKASVTGIVEFCKSPKHYLSYVNRKKVTTDLMRFGTAFHMSVLEPEKFPLKVKTIDQVAKEVRILNVVDDFKEYLIEKEQDIKKLKKDQLVELALNVRKDKSEFMLESEVKDEFIILSQESFEKLQHVQTSVFSHPFYQVNKNYGQKELRLKGKIEGIDVTGQLDQTLKKKQTNFVIDYKTTQSASFRAFKNKVLSEKSFVQMWCYNELLRQNFEGVDNIKNVWFAAETVEPFISQPFILSHASLYDTELYVKQKLHEFKICLENEDFFGYTNESYEVIDIPNYAFENTFDLEIKLEDKNEV